MRLERDARTTMPESASSFMNFAKLGISRQKSKLSPTFLSNRRPKIAIRKANGEVDRRPAHQHDADQIACATFFLITHCCFSLFGLRLLFYVGSAHYISLWYHLDSSGGKVTKKERIPPPVSPDILRYWQKNDNVCFIIDTPTAKRFKVGTNNSHLPPKRNA